MQYLFHAINIHRSKIFVRVNEATTPSKIIQATILVFLLKKCGKLEIG